MCLEWFSALKSSITLQSAMAAPFTHIDLTEAFCALLCQNTSLVPHTLHRLISAVVSWWVTFDSTESLLLPELNMCIDAIEYNPNVSKEQTSVCLSFIVEIKQILCLYMYSYQNIKRVISKLHNFFFKLSMWGIACKKMNGAETSGWSLGPAVYSKGPVKPFQASYTGFLCAWIF